MKSYKREWLNIWADFWVLDEVLCFQVNTMNKDTKLTKDVAVAYLFKNNLVLEEFPASCFCIFSWAVFN